MKTLLIVEDEKLIRQGIKTMVQRSGVPVELIMECANGEAALEVLQDQHIDVMFTDIRMPKMDGIELVHRVHEEIENPPIIVAISGYDDFSYAVEMMRNGVREYILKPVEREKVVEVLTNLEKELSQKNEHYINERKLGIAQLRNVLKDHLSQEEMILITQKYEQNFFQENYVACLMSRECEIEDNGAVFLVPDMEPGQVTFVEERNLAAFIKNELSDKSVGISMPHKGIAELKAAYEEAIFARKKAFCGGAGKQYTYEQAKSGNAIREELLATGAKLLEESARMQRMQRIGTEKTDELTALWEKFFNTVRKEHISMDDFLAEMENFLSETKSFYRNSFEESDEETFGKLRNVLHFENLDDYEEALSAWIMEFHERINSKDDEEDKNKAKIETALEYIQKNYKNDLNMAVVSNHISMNYTMFSYSFKQYTGMNFTAYLKDVRIAEAKRLLEETDMKVIDISWEVGYENEKNFMKVFKSVCGVSPSEYRKNVLR